MSAAIFKSVFLILLHSSTAESAVKLTLKLKPSRNTSLNIFIIFFISLPFFVNITWHKLEFLHHNRIGSRVSKKCQVILRNVKECQSFIVFGLFTFYLPQF